MTDIQQWRRKIQPSRMRTPTTPFDNDEPEEELLSSAPKRGLKPKFSSYFSHAQKQSPLGDTTLPPGELPVWSTECPCPDPVPEEVMDSVMCRLMISPYEPLDPAMNSSLMLIFEGFLKLKDEKALLQQQVDGEKALVKAVVARFDAAKNNWDDEKRLYKEELKRLEVILAKASKRGLAEVTLARQDSKLRARSLSSREKKETILEFLDKSNRHDDMIWSNQRATMRPLLPSPSGKDKRMSRELAQKKSMTNIHAELPFGTPPRNAGFSPTNVSFLDQCAKTTGRNRALTSSDTSESGETVETVETFSTFSCEGDMLSNGAAHATAAVTEDGMDGSSPVEQIATVVSRQHYSEHDRVVPQLLDIQAPNSNRSSSLPTSAVPEIAVPAPAKSTKALREAGHTKHRTVMSKASGFFQKLKPTMIVDVGSTSFPASRTFSFERGDDGASQGSHPNSKTRGGTRIIRKSVSLMSLNRVNSNVVAGTLLSPVAQSPTNSAAPGQARPPSRIPTPVFSSGHLVRLRQEREDSTSSLLTAFRATGGSHRSSSRTSSLYNSPPASDIDLQKASQAFSSPQISQLGLGASSNSHLEDRTNSLRGASVAVAPATARAPSSSNGLGPAKQNDWKERSACRNSDGPLSRSDMSDVRWENVRPMD